PVRGPDVMGDRFPANLPKIEAIDTIVPGPKYEMAPLLFVRVHAGGLVGAGDTFYAPQATATFILEFFAPLLLVESADPRAHWMEPYRSVAKFVGIGLEVRALSALDVALRDIASRPRDRRSPSYLQHHRVRGCRSITPAQAEAMPLAHGQLMAGAGGGARWCR